MIELIERLIERGHAYQAGGDVYFDVRTDPGYGELSGQRLAEMRPAEETAGGPTAALKRDPHDFVLWKGAKPGEPSWRTPWGPGRPGWHLECSAMSTHYLGSTFDIHGGGIDLIFPHHENERAQSTTAGDRFARYWVHHGLVVLSGRKVSKSEGRALAAAEALTQVRPQELRYYLGQAHYRSPLEYSQEALEEAVAAYQRIERFVARAEHAVMSRDGHLPHLLDAPGTAPTASLPLSFVAAMDEDLGSPGRARGRARGSARRQLRSYHGEHREYPGPPDSDQGHAHGPRPRPARPRLADQRSGREAPLGGRRAGRAGAARAGNGAGAGRLCFGRLHQGHFGGHRGGGR